MSMKLHLITFLPTKSLVALVYNRWTFYPLSATEIQNCRTFFFGTLATSKMALPTDQSKGTEDERGYLDTANALSSHRMLGCSKETLKVGLTSELPFHHVHLI